MYMTTGSSGFFDHTPNSEPGITGWTSRETCYSRAPAHTAAEQSAEERQDDSNKENSNHNTCNHSSREGTGQLTTCSAGGGENMKHQSAICK